MKYSSRMMWTSAFCSMALGLAVAATGGSDPGTRGPVGTGSLNYSHGPSGHAGSHSTTPSRTNGADGATGSVTSPDTSRAASSTPGLGATN